MGCRYMKRKVIDTIIDLGCEVEALDKIEGLTEEFKNKLFYENAKKFYGF